jgi:hypothetical protein
MSDPIKDATRSTARQLANEHRAEAEHADCAEQIQGRDRGGSIADRLLRKYSGGVDPIAKTKCGSEAGSGGETPRIAQQILIPSQNAKDRS